EQVGEAGGGGALVGLRSPGPAVHQVDAVAPADQPARNGVGRGEAGAQDDGVHLPFLAVGGDDAVGTDLGDAVGNEGNVRFGQRRVVVVGDQHALAAHHVVGGQLAAQLRVADLAAQVMTGHQAGHAQDVRTD